MALASNFIFSEYKDITDDLPGNNVISTVVTGSSQPVIQVVPNWVVTWAFATGSCGSESWEGAVSGSTLASANVSQWVSANQAYIISTGGAGGTFTCSGSSGFLSFIKRYYSANMLGVDFDIENGQTQTQVNQLVSDVKTAEASYPNMRFSFTIPTEGGTAGNSFGPEGTEVMNAIKSYSLGGNYTINLMVMDFGDPPSSSYCVVVNGSCEMAQSAIQAAKDLHSAYGTPYSHIELTPMIGTNDNTDEVFSLSDVDTMSSWAVSNGIAGVHFWSLDRDTDCSLGTVSDTCNGDPGAGVFGFANRFISDLGLNGGTPTPAPTATPAPTPTPSSGPLSGTISSTVVFYDYFDNGNSCAIAHPVIHSCAGGTGTWSDPITFAASTSNDTAMPYGSKIYVPFLQRYFIREDDCASGSCVGDTVNLWVGGNNTDVSADVAACEKSLTPSGPVNVIYNPPSNEPVSTLGALWNESNGMCNGTYNY
jgi:chitinase